jgi:GT2 family glycosyltransferase
MEDINVSIIYVNYNTEKDLSNSIKSVIQNTAVSNEIIVVDNNSAQKSIDKLKEEFGERIRFVISDQNLGFGKANNLGVENAKSNIVFFLNPDTVLINNAIDILYDFLVHNDAVGACGASLFDGNLNPAHSGLVKQLSARNFRNTYFNAVKSKLVRKIMKKKTHNLPKSPFEVKDIIGADLMMKKEVFNKVGGFDKDFFMYAEESELNNRVYNAGYKLYLVPSAKIMHLEGSSFKEGMNELQLKYFINGNLLYMLKVFGSTEVDKFIKNYIKSRKAFLPYWYVFKRKRYYAAKKAIEIAKNEYEIFKKNLCVEK